ncbi:MAG TPA: RNA methyltransferase [Kiritimatiellia bacterium]|nr:RNA methyltransferase [Kiritimatiellia bacterium]HMO98867.1 RNA methyltransferase [Kiritimatiellia bacterium]HMP97288.1 RNA methyltransferase [Kiritimatiellia bacterium]
MSLRNVQVVLVRSLYGGNIGSVCRAIKNMGLSNLRLVTPRETVDYEEAAKMALSAGDILEARQVFPDLASAVADCAQVAGTTARDGLYRAHAYTAREWAPVFLSSARAHPVAMVFGPEDHGLSNEELALCTQIIRIPSSPNYSSLNLSHAVMVCAYELFVATGHFQPTGEHHPEAPSVMRERMVAMWETTLREIGFFDDEKSEHMMMAMRRIFSRGKLSVADVNILMGVARQTQWRIRHPVDPAS